MTDDFYMGSFQYSTFFIFQVCYFLTCCFPGDARGRVNKLWPFYKYFLQVINIYRLLAPEFLSRRGLFMAIELVFLENFITDEPRGPKMPYIHFKSCCRLQGSAKCANTGIQFAPMHCILYVTSHNPFSLCK